MALLLPGERSEGCPLLSVPDGEPTKKVIARTLLSVEYLKVNGPSDRRDDLCSIYGYFRVSDKERCAIPVTLFDRERDEAETIDFGQPLFQFIPLSDDDSARPVLAGSCRFYVQMKLWEKIVDDQFTIVKDIAPPGAEEVRAQTQITGKRKHHFGRTIYGSIEAIQSIRDEMTSIELFYRTFDDPVPAPVDIGSPVVLKRKLLVVPTDGGCVGISYSLLNAANDELITEGTIPFRIREDIRGIITAPENLTYTQPSKDGLVSASITLLPYTYDPGWSTSEDGGMVL